MDDAPATDDPTARIAALEAEVCHLNDMVKQLSAAVIDTARASGYRIRHVKLARLALKLGYIKYRDFDT